MSLCHICIYCSWLRNWNCWCYWCLFFSTGVIGFITYNSLSHAHMRITGKTSNWCIWCIVFIDFLGSSPKRKFRGATICIEALFKYIYHGKPRFLKKNRAYFTNFLRAQKKTFIKKSMGFVVGSKGWSPFSQCKKQPRACALCKVLEKMTSAKSVQA